MAWSCARCVPSATISAPPSICCPACFEQSAAKVLMLRFSYPSRTRTAVQMRKRIPARKMMPCRAMKFFTNPQSGGEEED